MDSNETIKQYLATKNNDTIKTNQSDLKVENVTLLENVTSDSIIFWGIVGFIVCWTAIFLMLSKRGRFARKEVAVNIKTLHQIPCRDCKFYSNDPYIKCAVNPSTVLTGQAVDCSDYCAKENKSF